jgi:hypothetical protein
MLVSRLISPARRGGAVLGVACLVVAASTQSAPGSETAPVSVRVEGLSETRLPPTQVVLGNAPVVKDGNPEHACPAHSALAALELATGGSWGGPWNAKFKQYELFTIEGETHLFEPEAKANYFWSFWLDDKEAEAGACEALVNPGDRVLFLVGCFGEACPQPAPTPLGIEAPSSANVREQVQVTVRSFSRTGVSAEVAGATVSGADAPATTDAHGHTTLTFSRSGSSTVHVTAPASIRTQATICVHNGNDGTCGTQTPSGVTPPPAAGAQQNLAVAPYKGPYAIIARSVGLIDGHSYSRRRAPRLLAGMVTAHTGVSSVGIELWRSYRGRCYAYDGARERFARARCKHGGFFRVPGGASFFKVSSTSRFSYLLPFALPPGEYVLDIEATDTAGNHTVLARGTSRVRFNVR